MVIVPGGKKGTEPDKPTAALPPLAPPVRSMKPPEPVEQTAKEAFQPKLEKQVREDAPKRPSPPKVSQSFDHIFELTQGNLDSPGLVVVNGAQGSGKTTLCSGLASSFLKQGSPCMFVTYDKAPGALREQMKKIGADPSKAPKDVVKWLEDTASCVIDLDKDDSDPSGRELKVRKLNGSASKLDTETFEIDSSKGLVFVK